MKKDVSEKFFDVNGWFIILFILLVGAFAIAYMDLRSDLRLLQEQTGNQSPIDPASI